MSEDSVAETPTIHDLTARGREKIAQAQSGAKDALTLIADYTRANPWVAIAGAAVIGGLVVALSKSHKPASPTDIVREWLDEMSAKLPSQKQVQSVVETSGVPEFLILLKKKLHLS